MTSHFQSSGRGGAGNIVDSSKTPQLQPEDLQTPTLKTSMVTTGRGGTGNFAVGLDADEKRRRQDVVPVVRRDSHGATHIGRGGTGNVVVNKDAPSAPGAKSPALSGAAAATTEKPGSPAATPITAIPTIATTTTPATAAAAAADKDKDKERQLRKVKSAPPVRSGDDGNGEGDDVAVPARRPEEIGWAEKGMNLLFGKK
ncbi:hypothetical protein C8A01DRAFT_32962 [Parachaetomium inaequale]|uniref:Uncharacterized protein n=1 Tax=Parachaetomium inaequale TaxID=2588326 RepID=A0AAN6PLL6_9PEZI|nr:hypothetical protein C8A01DRAFT_32962 [Parachaetomium inaequale]